MPGWLLSRPAAIVVAHPDDEVLGVGTLLPHFKNLRAIIHVTDGAPRRGPDVGNAGASSWQEYAALRRREFEAAAHAAGVENAEFICLNYPDQEASFHLAQLTRGITGIFCRLRVRVVFTHPYEGGHPDHDACAAAVRFACSRLPRGGRPEVFEFASYHALPDGGVETECFLGNSSKMWSRVLTDVERRKKRDVLSCYASQQAVLSGFPVCQEPIRMAPDYDFTKPPHRGKLNYENFDWGMTGARWRRLVRRAITAFKFPQTQ